MALTEYESPPQFFCGSLLLLFSSISIMDQPRPFFGPVKAVLSNRLSSNDSSKLLLLLHPGLKITGSAYNGEIKGNPSIRNAVCIVFGEIQTLCRHLEINYIKKITIILNNMANTKDKVSSSLHIWPFCVLFSYAVMTVQWMYRCTQKCTYTKCRTTTVLNIQRMQFFMSQEKWFYTTWNLFTFYLWHFNHVLVFQIEWLRCHSLSSACKL